MSVVGFDLGNGKSKIAIARRRGIDIAVNDVSNRETPTLVSFNGHERFMGESATTQVVSNAKNTVNNLMRLVGEKFDSPTVRKVLETSSLVLKPAEDGTVLVEVTYEDKQQTFTPQRLLAMVLSNLRATAEQELKTSVVDCVITVPSHFGVAQRHAVLDAARIIGLNPLRLINTTTAAALQWGFYRVPEEGQVVCICDCGESSFEVGVVEFGKDRLKVLGIASSEAPCGSSFDYALAQHLNKVFLDKYKIDPMSRPRPKVRLLQAAEKAKRVLSGIAQTPVNIECLMDDIDVSAIVTRDEFEGLVKPLVEDIPACIARALAMAGKTHEQVSCVELVGGSSWMPVMASSISASFPNNLPVSRTLNASESVAKGTCLQCAMLSVTLKVRDYVVEEMCPYTIVATWNTPQGEEKRATLFEQKGKIPDRKLLTFMRDEPFEITVQCKETNELVAKCQVSGMKDAATRLKELEDLKAATKPVDALPPSKIKVAFELTSDGVVIVDGAHVHEEYEVQVPVKEDAPAAAAPATPSTTTTTDAPPTPADGTQPTDPAAAAPPADSPAPADAAGDADMKDVAQPKMTWKKKTLKTQIVSELKNRLGLSLAQLTEESNNETKLVTKDREIKQRLDAKNSLESYVYDMRDKLSDSTSKHAKFIEEQDRTGFLGLLRTCEDWLYSDEGEEATRAVYADKLAELKRIGDLVEELCAEAEARPDAYAAVEASILANRELAQSTDEKYAHIAQEDRDKCLAKCTEIETSLAEKRKTIDAQPKSQKPAFTCAQIQAMAAELDKFCKPIMSKAKPAPPKPAPAPASTDAQPQADQAAAPQDAPATPQDTPAASQDSQQQQQPAAEGAPKPTVDMDLD